MPQANRVIAVAVALVIGILLEQGAQRYVFTGANDFIKANKADAERRKALEAKATPAPHRRVAAPAPHPNWAGYTEISPISGAHVFHAKLTETPAEDSDEAPPGAGPSQMELLQQRGHPSEAILTLGAVNAANCAQITQVEALFDNRIKKLFAAAPHPGDGACIVSVVQGDLFRYAVLNAETLLVTPLTAKGRMGPVMWHVGGLFWNGD